MVEPLSFLTYKKWMVLAILFLALIGYGYVQYMEIALLNQKVLTKEEELKSTQEKLQGAQAAYRTAIAEKHALVSDLYDNRKRLEERTKELQVMKTSHEEKVKTVRRTTDASGHFDACLPADVLSLYPNARPCP